MNSSKLNIKNVEKSFFQGGKKLDVLCGVNAEFEQGKTYSIVGVSGSGKSTLMHILGGLDFPDSGDVLFDEKSLSGLKQSEKEKLLNQKLGFVFQFHYLIKELTVLENIIMMGLIKGDSRKDCEKRGKELLQKTGLTEKVDSYPTQLSGGQLQRVSILRAIFNKPDFLLADEPTGDLDVDNASGIIDLLLQSQKEWGMGIVLCSHDKNVYEKMETILRLKDGILTQEK